MACLLLLNGLRVSEVCGIDIDDLAEERRHHTVTIHGKGDKDATVPLAPRTRAAVEQAVDGRDGGPLLCNRWGNLMSRNNVAAAVASLAREAGIARRMTPHTLRHAAITAALNAGAHLRDVQDFARHADPRPPCATTATATASTGTPPTPSPSTSPAPSRRSGRFLPGVWWFPDARPVASS
jgi:integrase/recombinase XerD